MSGTRISTRALEKGQLEGRVTAKAIAVLKIAEEIANTARPVGKGLYEINPETILSLRESLRRLEDEGGINRSVSIRCRGFE
jgi:hypothetical protein